MVMSSSHRIDIDIDCSVGSICKCCYGKQINN